MDRPQADAALSNSPELVLFIESSIAQARELERRLLENDIPVSLAKPPAKACCAGGCGCGAKVQLLGREEDLPRLSSLLQSEWLEAVRREGTVGESGLVPLGVPGEEACPACQFAGPLKDGACADCGLQLE